MTHPGTDSFDRPGWAMSGRNFHRRTRPINCRGKTTEKTELVRSVVSLCPLWPRARGR